MSNELKMVWLLNMLSIAFCHRIVKFPILTKRNWFQFFNFFFNFLHDAVINRLQFCSNFLIHILSLSNSNNSVTSIIKNWCNKLHLVIVALEGPKELLIWNFWKLLQKSLTLLQPVPSTLQSLKSINMMHSYGS